MMAVQLHFNLIIWLICSFLLCFNILFTNILLNTSYTAMLKRNIVLLSLSKQKYSHVESFNQNMWALGTVVFALFFHSGIFDHQLGPTITKISRISFTSLAVISIVGSIYLYFKSKNLVKQSIHTPLVDQRPSQKVNHSPSSSAEIAPKSSSSAYYIKPHSHFKPISKITNERVNFDYSFINSSVDKVLRSSEKDSMKSQHTPSSNHNIISNTAIFSTPPEYYGSLSPPFVPHSSITSTNNLMVGRPHMNITMSTPTTANNVTTNFLKYFSSPPSEKNSPIPVGDRLVSRGRAGVTRTVDALKILQISDIAAIDDWISNLKRLLFQHLFETLEKFDESVKVIKNELYSKGVPFELLDNIENVLSFKSDIELGLNGESMDLDHVVTRCRNLNIYALQDYLQACTIFCLRGASSGYDFTGRKVDRSSLLHTIKRMREIASHPEHYLRIDFNYRHSVISSNNISSSAGVSTPLSPYSNYSPPHDSDIAVGIFFHMCQTALNSSLMSTRSKFIADHYADDVSLIPEPSLPGLSKGIDKVGIVRTISSNKGSSATNDSIRMNTDINNNAERPHFNVFIIHDPSKPELSPYSRHRCNSVVDSNNATTHHSSHTLSMTGGKIQIDSWPTGESGIEILKIIEGRQNCFEALVIFLVVLVGRAEDPATIRSLGQGATFQRMIFDIFKVSDWAELELLLHTNRSVRSPQTFRNHFQ